MASLDSEFSAAHPGVIVDIPTGVGFCMYISAAPRCPRSVCFPSSASARATAKRNDFCFRARNQGWRNVLSADTFVYHSGGVSFADTQNPRKAPGAPDAAYALSRLRVRRSSPSWDPARALRAAIETRRLQKDSQPVVLSISHALGGGTHKARPELAQHLTTQATFLTLMPKSDGRVALRWLQEGSSLELFSSSIASTARSWIGCAWLACRVHIHHTLGVPPVLWGLARDLHLPPRLYGA